jgi:dolichol-phosphate mannosyltransferase
MIKLSAERIRFIRFCTVGGSGVFVNLAVFSLFMELLLLNLFPDRNIRFVISNVAGFLASVLTNFLLNDYWTWGDREKRGHRHFVGRLYKFYLVSSAAGIVQIGVAWTARSYLGGDTLMAIGSWQINVMDQLAVVIGIGVATVINYVANNLWTFRDTVARDDP